MHNHLPTSELKEIMNHREVLKTEAMSGSLNKPRRMIRSANHELSAEVIAQLPSTDASRQAINRIRSSNVDGGVNPTCRENVSISRELQTTFNGMKFLFEDTQDGDRVLVFTTTDNLNIMRKNLDWLVDGTFSIAPKIYTQLFSFHASYFGKNLPLVYCLLPDKTKKTYVKMFKLLSYHLDVAPDSINYDFEKGIHSAIRTKWTLCQICGCFFHLSQSWLRRLKMLKIYTNYMRCGRFNSSFKQCQALCYIPESEVQSGLNEIKENAPASFLPMIDFIQRVYVKPLDSTSSKPKYARFPVNTWSLYQRILDGLSTSNNSVESWHSALTVIISLINYSLLFSFINITIFL